MKKILILLLLTITVFAGDFPFELPALKLKDSYSPLYPKNRPFGTSAQWGDSSGFFIFNQGVKTWGALYTLDSLIVTTDAWITGSIYFDTSGSLQIYGSGYDLALANTKASGTITITTPIQLDLQASDAGGQIILSYGGVGGNQIATFTSTGMLLSYGDLSLTGGTQQIKFPSDTVSDYDWNDTVVINKQSGIITTDTLGTDAGQNYILIITNSLVATTSKVLMTVNGDNNSSGVPMIRTVNPLTGEIYVVLTNIHATDPLNSWVKLSFLVLN